MAGKTGASSKTKKNSGNTRKTRTSGNAKQSSAKSAKASNKTQSNSSSSVTKRENTILTQLFPGILILISLLIALSLIIPDRMGGLGPIVKNTLYGLFSHGAVIVPILIFIGAFFWRRDHENHAVWYKVIFAFFLTVFVSVLLYVFTGSEMIENKTEDILYFFEQGKNSVGGGAAGGLIGMLLYRGIGSVGTVIVSLVLVILLSIFYVGLTPYMVWLRIAYEIHERRERRNVAKEDTRKTPVWVDEQKYYTNEKAYNEMNNCSDTSERKKGKQLDISAVDTSVDEISDDTAEKEKISKKIPKIFGIFSSENYTDSSDKTTGTVIDENPETDISDKIDPSIFENVLQKQNEAIAQGLSSDDIDANLINKAGSDDEFDAIADIIEKEDEAEKLNGVTESAEKLASFAEKNQSESEQNNPISDELLTRFLSNSDENGKGAAEFDRTYTENIVNGPQDPELILQKDALDIASVKVPPKKKQKYVFPPLSLLSAPVSPINTDISEELQTTAKKLIDTLTSFKVNAKVINISRGPTITRYELAPESGVRVRAISALVDDISLNLAASGVRIEAPIPGKAAVGIEVPNRVVATVYLRELVSNEKFTSATSKLTASLGEDVAGEPIYLDIAKMPHLLIAGATGQGKSVCINSMIVSLLYKAKPDEVKFILIDPKKVELNIYNGLPHLLVPVVSDPKKAAGALQWAVTEMERRFNLIEEVGVRDLKGYNKAVENDRDTEKLPQIVIIIDELADLMMTAPDDVEESICRLAQKARAAGMHLILGTQRPSVDVITGLIKANVPSRIAFRVSAQMDSRVILDMTGAEKLIGRGDMLFSPVGSTKPIRVQGAYVSETEIDNIISFIAKTYGAGDYDDSIIEQIEQEAQKCGTSGSKKGGASAADNFDGDGFDPMLKSAIELAVDNGKISTSLIQRRLSLGYGRAAKLIDRMQDMGVVSPPEGQKPRTVLITRQQFMEMVINNETE